MKIVKRLFMLSLAVGLLGTLAAIPTFAQHKLGEMKMDPKPTMSHHTTSHHKMTHVEMMKAKRMEARKMKRRNALYKLLYGNSSTHIMPHSKM